MSSKNISLKNKLTVGVPIYNDQYLQQLLVCLSEQTISRDVFFIFSNDNYNNNKINQLLDSFKLKFNCEVFKNKKPLGAMENHLYILEKVKTPFFMWICDDDYLGSNEYLENMLDQILIKKTDFLMPNVKILKNSDLYDFAHKENWIQSSNNNDMLRMTFKECGFLFYSLFKTKIILDNIYLIEKRKTNLHYNEGVFIHKIALTYKGYFYSKESIIIRDHENNLSKDKNADNHLKGYINYFFDSIFLILRSNLSLKDKLIFFFNFVKSRASYLIKLIIKFILNKKKLFK